STRFSVRDSLFLLCNYSVAQLPSFLPPAFFFEAFNGAFSLALRNASLLRPRLQRARSRCASSAHPYFLPPAFFLLAFNGSTVVEPAKPRRSRGGFSALRIKM